MKNLDRLAWIGSLAAALLLGACSSTPLSTPAPVTSLPPQAQAPASTVAPVAAAPVQAAPVARAVVPEYLDPASPLSRQRSVYFDFDQYVLKPEGQKLLELHGKFLASHPTVAIRIEGNTDEQGGAEYNLALGEKRAQAVQKALKVFGVADKQMEAVSFGKEKPRNPGHDEAAHAENRRADLDYPKQ